MLNRSMLDREGLRFSHEASFGAPARVCLWERVRGVWVKHADFDSFDEATAEMQRRQTLPGCDTAFRILGPDQTPE
jgi:hypothetical protein